MSKSLDRNFQNWLEGLADEWEEPFEQIVQKVGQIEIENRTTNYPRVAAQLLGNPLELSRFADAVRDCWVMGYSIDAIRFNRFVSEDDRAIRAINNFLYSFPDDDAAAVQRIDQFIEDAVSLGIAKPENKPDRAGAASLASLILTTLYPTRFVDFRRTRWKTFAEILQYDLPQGKPSHGAWIVWAGQFGQAVSQTKTYTQYWIQPDEEAQNPLWVISGICWDCDDPQRPPPDPVDPDALSFPEGSEKRRLHITHERNRTLIKRAKEMGIERDALLRCQICGFSFIETYGELGRGFIEAHHKQPIAELKERSLTKLDDIGLVCANCHRMLHSGSKTLSMEELRELLQTQTKL